MTAATILPLQTTASDAASWESAYPRNWEMRQVARHIGSQYQIVRELGRGGMGVVFLARDIALHRLVAIKVLRVELSRSEEHRERFRREARMTARLHHPNIVPVFGFGEKGDFVYIVMKYVHGESLAERMQRDGTVEPTEARRILMALAGALAMAHREGMVHRDLKAENVMLDRDSGEPMIADFGVALLRSLDPVRGESLMTFGTPLYMSPEQVAGERDIDGRSDLYSLGVLGYYMLAGTMPFEGATFESLAAKHVTEPPPPLDERARDLPAGFSPIIERCLAKRRDDRFRDGGELAAALERVRISRRRWFLGV